VYCEECYEEADDGMIRKKRKYKLVEGELD